MTLVWFCSDENHLRSCRLKHSFALYWVHWCLRETWHLLEICLWLLYAEFRVNEVITVAYWLCIECTVQETDGVRVKQKACRIESVSSVCSERWVTVVVSKARDLFSSFLSCSLGRAETKHACFLPTRPQLHSNNSSVTNHTLKQRLERTEYQTNMTRAAQNFTFPSLKNRKKTPMGCMLQ